MKFSRLHTLKEIAELLGAEAVGDPGHPVTGLNEIHCVEEGDVVFVDHPKYYGKALNCAATTVLINAKMQAPAGKALLVVKDPFSAFNRLITHFKPVYPPQKEMIAPSAKVGEDSVIMPGVFLGNGVTIGRGCLIHSGVVIYENCHLGDHVIIHSGTVIGADAFYFKKRESHFEKLISCGRVIIEDDVEIGALCSVDRGVTADTIVGRGTKIDNHVQIGHDTVTGEMCLMASQVGISGVVKVGNRVTIWGQAGVSSDITIADGAVVLAQSGVGMNLEAGKSYFGTPAGDAREKMRELAQVKRIPEILEKLKRLKAD
ncbi:MAG: UDP-3-O-(3-hydroxymyristoyl)glucosamine N-acyltransferase [Bacteroidia bacterium]|nr:UDP-3-O-(3-hydroxymyristoyl)glucosamine N-acyltransferase [Bacteroidia bacterium]